MPKTHKGVVSLTQTITTSTKPFRIQFNSIRFLCYTATGAYTNIHIVTNIHIMQTKQYFSIYRDQYDCTLKHYCMHIY